MSFAEIPFAAQKVPAGGRNDSAGYPLTASPQNSSHRLACTRRGGVGSLGDKHLAMIRRFNPGITVPGAEEIERRSQAHVSSAHD